MILPQDLPRVNRNTDTAFGIYKRLDGQLGMGNKVVQLDEKTLAADDTKYELTPGLRVLIGLKRPHPSQWKTNDYKVCKSLVAQTKLKSFPHKEDPSSKPKNTWKWKSMPKKIVIPGERIAEESEDIDDTDSVESGSVSMRNFSESSDIPSPVTASIGDFGESPDVPRPSVPSSLPYSLSWKC